MFRNQAPRTNKARLFVLELVILFLLFLWPVV